MCADNETIGMVIYMKKTAFVLSEQRQTEESKIRTVLYQAIITWLTKELYK